MRRLTFVTIAILMLVCSTASARSFTDPGSMVPKEYRYVENADGTYTEWYKGVTGQAIRGDTYSAAEMVESDRVFAQVAVDSGTTGQGGSILVGSDGDNIYAAERIVGELRTGEPYATGGEAEVGDELITEGVDLGTLPPEVTVAGASAGALLGTLAGGLAVGVAIGTGIDELMHWPSLFSAETGSKIEPGCFYEHERNCVWTTFIHEYQVRLGGVGACEYKSWSFPYALTRLPETEGEEWCEYPEVPTVGRWSYVNTYEGETQEEGSCTQFNGNSGLGGAAGGIFDSQFPPGPECGYHLVPEYCFGNSWVRCIQGFSGPGGETYLTPQPSYNVVFRQVYAPLFQTMSPDAYPAEGLKEYERGVEAPSSHTVSPETPVTTPVTVPLPATVPAPARHKVIEKAKKPQTKKEEEEKTAPVPLIPPIEKGEEGEEIPSPTTPEIPQIKPNENWTEYKEALEKEGYKTLHENVLPETAIDPNTGPNDVTNADPAPGTRAVPTTIVTVDVNPEDAPIPGEAHAPIGPPTEPGLKLPNFGVLCHGFPFGVPCWLVSTIVAMSTTAKAPDWTVVPEIEVSGHKVREGRFNFATLEPVMEVVRPAMIAFTTIGIVLLFYSFAKGGGPPSGSNADSVPMSEPDDDIYL